jgi:hypothetical protein
MRARGLYTKPPLSKFHILQETSPSRSLPFRDNPSIFRANPSLNSVRFRELNLGENFSFRE